MKIAIELGGTKIIMAAGNGPDDLGPWVRIPTTTPQATIEQICAQLSIFQKSGPIEAIGLASFGPIRVDPKAVGFGTFFKTTKPGWSHFDLLTPIRNTCPHARIGLDTDVNAAAMAEVRWGGAQGLSDVTYITVGTGIGVGVICGGLTTHGLMHPEAGHILAPKHPEDMGFDGVCPFHTSCIEGMASGPSLKARTGQDGEAIDDDDPIFDRIAYYLAHLCVNLILTNSPQRILIGGGAGLRPRLVELCRAQVSKMLGGYIEPLSHPKAMDTYIIPAGLGDRAGLLGALALIS